MYKDPLDRIPAPPRRRARTRVRVCVVYVRGRECVGVCACKGVCEGVCVHESG